MKNRGLKNAITKCMIYREMNKVEHLQRITPFFACDGGNSEALWNLMRCACEGVVALGNAHNGACLPIMG